MTVLIPPHFTADFHWYTTSNTTESTGNTTDIPLETDGYTNKFYHWPPLVYHWKYHWYTSGNAIKFYHWHPLVYHWKPREIPLIFHWYTTCLPLVNHWYLLLPRWQSCTHTQNLYLFEAKHILLDGGTVHKRALMGIQHSKFINEMQHLYYESDCCIILIRSYLIA